MPRRGSTEGGALKVAPPFAPDLVWSVLLDPPLDGATNMARDHALAVALPPGRGVLRIYGWSAPTLSFGRNEPTRGRWDRNALVAGGVDVVRRPTGGRAVLHQREITYALVAPLPDRGRLRAAYAAVNAALVAGLGELGVGAGLQGEGPTAPLDQGACFASPAPGEVVAGGRKLVGSAQVRIAGRLLQHGSVLLADDQGRVDRYRRALDTKEVGAGGPAGAPLPASLTDLLGATPEPDAVAAALLLGFARSLQGHWLPDERDGTLAKVTRPHESALRERYASEAWTWRR